MKKHTTVLILLCLSLCLCCCSPDSPVKGSIGSDNGSKENTGSEKDKDNTVTTTFGTLPEIPDVTFPDSAVSSGSTEQYNGANVIELSTDGISFSGSGAAVDGNRITVSSAGSYVVRGKLSDGQLIVNTADEEKVELILDGADITCLNSSPIYVLSAPKKVVIRLADNSVNLLCDDSTYASLFEDNPTATLYSKEDLEIKGKGALYVTGNYSKGIYSKDDLEIEDGEIYVNSVDDGIRGKDSLTVSGGRIVVSAAADGLRTTNAEEAEKGNMYILGGEIYVTAGNDALQSENSVYVQGGTLTLKSGGGNTGAPAGDNGFGGGWPGMNQGTSDSSESNHGIKALSTVSVSGGTVVIDSSHDALHSDSAVQITGGSLHISASDDGIHAEETLDISDGYIYIEDSYEGYEAKKITVGGGTTVIHSTDDGMNAAGGSSSGGGMMRPGSGGDTSAYLLTISGGNSVVYADGDGIDSNGNIVMTGGSCIVFGPTNSGNGAIDYGDGNNDLTISGGTLMASGSLGMADCATGDGQQVIFASTGNIQAGDVVGIADSEGNIIFVFENPKLLQCIVFSSPELEESKEYSVYSGGSVDASPVNNVFYEGTYTAGRLVTTVTASEAPSTGNSGQGGMGPGQGGGRPR